MSSLFFTKDGEHYVNNTMELPSLISSLSLNDTPSNITNFAAKINGQPTEFVLGTFTNQNLVIATQFGKLSTLYTITVDQTENEVCPLEPVYSVHPLFGAENDHAAAAARFITKELNIRKQLVIFLSLKDYNKDTVLKVVGAIKNYSSDGSCKTG